jgi:septum formation protein
MSYWKKTDRKVILASGSPRRKQILSLMGLVFETIVPCDIYEKKFFESSDLDGALKALAIVKATQIANEYPQALVLGADTIVVKDSLVLGKPKDKEDAYEMLKSLSGNRHQVKTGVALVCTDTSFVSSTVVSTDVFFRDISEIEICDYLSMQEYVDKAGAYAIQGNALTFVEKIEGCYYNVVGLPVSGTINLFKEFNDRKESADV